MIHAIFWDLDNTLVDTERSLKQQRPETLWQRMQEADRDSVLKDAYADAMYTTLLNEGIVAMSAAYSIPRHLLSSLIAPYVDVDTLSSFPTTHYLITAGERSLQEAKIDATHLRSAFNTIYVVDEQAGNQDKYSCFSDILLSDALSPEYVLVVGDNCQSEIVAGNQLDVQTAQLLRPHVTPGPLSDNTLEQPDWYIPTLYDLRYLLSV